MLRSLLFATWFALADANWGGNMNFGSPSVRHVALGIDTEVVKKRMLHKRDGSVQIDSEVQFTHGVASVSVNSNSCNTWSDRSQGDPYARSVILWTRASPVLENDRSNVTVEGTVAYFSHETEQYIKASKSPICVDWKVTVNANMVGQVVSSGRAYTTSDIDYTIKACKFKTSE